MVINVHLREGTKQDVVLQKKTEIIVFKQITDNDNDNEDVHCSNEWSSIKYLMFS